MTIRVGSLFSGVGGFEEGFERAGMKTVWNVEIDPQCRRVLQKHFPDATSHEDIRTVGSANLDAVDVVCGGFPCQGASVAGKGGGLSDARTGLWWEMLRVVRELRPELLVVENVPGLLSVNRGRDFGVILASLRECGYFGCVRTLDAQFFGVPQRRRRLFGVFARGHSGVGCCAEILALTKSRERHPPTGRKAGKDLAGSLGGGSGSRGWCDDTDRMTFVPDTSFTLDTKQRGVGNAWNNEYVAGQCHGSSVGEMGTLRRGNGNVTGGIPFIASTLRSRQSSPGVSGPGRGGEDDSNLVVASAVTASNGHHGHSSPRGDGSDNLVVGPALAGCVTTGEGGRLDGESCTFVAFNSTGGSRSMDCGPLSPPLRVGSGVGAPSSPAVMGGQFVRRLTPTECLRLQGFPDDWLDLDPPLSDSAKYRMTGNAVNVAVSSWLGRRIVATPFSTQEPVTREE